RVCAYMRAALERLVEALERAPETPVRSMDVLPVSERHQLLVEWNGEEADYPRDQLIHELIEERVAEYRDVAEVAQEDCQLKYGELNVRANRLAHHLRNLGVGPDARVALCVGRKPEMIVGLVAILKAGGAYVPLDPAYPTERLIYMLEDSEPVALLIDS